MNGSEICVCCGNTLTETEGYGMVCPECERRYGKSNIDTSTLIRMTETFFTVKLKWYQKVLLRIYAISLKIPRKGLHR